MLTWTQCNDRGCFVRPRPVEAEEWSLFIGLLPAIQKSQCCHDHVKHVVNKSQVRINQDQHMLLKQLQTHRPSAGREDRGTPGQDNTKEKDNFEFSRIQRMRKTNQKHQVVTVNVCQIIKNIFGDLGDKASLRSCLKEWPRQQHMCVEPFKNRSGKTPEHWLGQIAPVTWESRSQGAARTASHKCQAISKRGWGDSGARAQRQHTGDLVSKASVRLGRKKLPKRHQTNVKPFRSKGGETQEHRLEKTTPMT